MAEMKKAVDWITVNGNHVPIQKGQTKKEAVSKFFEDKKIEKQGLFDGAGSEDDKPIVHTGGKSGALRPTSKRAIKHAIQMYTQISRRKRDFYKIANITGYNPQEIKKVKDYIFVPTKTEEYTSLYGDIFNVSYEQSESWRRLAEGKPEPHDFTFIKHEMYELKLREKGYNYDEAHRIASRKYNYQKESDEYYEELEKNGKIKIERN